VSEWKQQQHQQNVENHRPLFMNDSLRFSFRFHAIPLIENGRGGGGGGTLIGRQTLFACNVSLPLHANRKTFTLSAKKRKNKT